MGSVDLVPCWQVIVVTLETVIASIELAGIIMQVRTQTCTIASKARVCLGAEARLYNAERQRLKQRQAPNMQITVLPP